MLQSHPSWVCGLKHRNPNLNRRIAKSHPSWVCGLKHQWEIESKESLQVTPFVGVWIETKVTDGNMQEYVRSHPSWVCGLKL